MFPQIHYVPTRLPFHPMAAPNDNFFKFITTKSASVDALVSSGILFRMVLAINEKGRIVKKFPREHLVPMIMHSRVK